MHCTLPNKSFSNSKANAVPNNVKAWLIHACINASLSNSSSIKASPITAGNPKGIVELLDESPSGLSTAGYTQGDNPNHRVYELVCEYASLTSMDIDGRIAHSRIKDKIQIPHPDNNQNGFIETCTLLNENIAFNNDTESHVFMRFLGNEPKEVISLLNTYLPSLRVFSYRDEQDDNFSSYKSIQSMNVRFGEILWKIQNKENEIVEEKVTEDESLPTVESGKDFLDEIKGKSKTIEGVILSAKKVLDGVISIISSIAKLS